MMPLHLAKITNQTDIALKNLGPQIRWSYLFYIEYAGPLLIFPLLFLLGDRQHYNEIQYIALIMGIIHFLKRELETAFVHVFSRASMPFKRLFINSLHYWIFFALNTGIELYFFPTLHTYN
jgi:very-long-chain enoyl-CoA reductase